METTAKLETVSSLIPIAFYGTLMSSGNAQKKLGILPRLRSLGPCQLPGTLLDLGSYPGLVDLESGGIVEAELFLTLDDSVLSLLDDYEGFFPGDPEGSLYLRRRVDLLQPDGEAWVYVYKGDRGGALKVKSGRWTSALSARGMNEV